MNILILCPERIASGRPAGIGIRMIEIAGVLDQAGHRVTLLSPDSGASGANHWSCGETDPESIRDATTTADAVILQGHIINEYLAHRSKKAPLIVDVYDPFLIEHLHYDGIQPGAFLNDHAATITSLLEGDFFLCASPAQRLFYIGMLSAVGRINPERFEIDPTLGGLIAIVPFGVARPRAQIPEEKPPHFLFGGIYDWYRPEIAIEAVEIARRSHPELSLTFVSHTNPSQTPQSQWSRARKKVDALGLESNVRFIDWFPYEERSSVYDEHLGSVLTFDPSIETDLSFRTRVLDYLWGGLPVISSSAQETDRILSGYGAGRVASSNSPDEIARLMGELIDQPASARQMVESTQRFTNDYQWEKVAEPLLEFCSSPEIDETKGLHRLQTTLERSDSLSNRVARKLRKLL